MDERLSGLVQVGGWWDRSNRHEFDVVGAQESGAVSLVGTIKWRARKAVSTAEVDAVASARAVIPQAARAQLAVICPAGIRRDVQADVVLNAEDVLAAFR